jgi:hypothetical protein
MPYISAAERDREVRQVRVAAERGYMVRDLHRVVVPVGEGHDREVAAVGDVDLHVVRVDGAAPLVDNHGGPPVRLHVDDQVACGRDAGVGACHCHVRGPRRHRFLRDRDHGRRGGGGEGAGADPVRREERGVRRRPRTF